MLFAYRTRQRRLRNSHYNGLANFRVSQPVFGINELCSDEMPYFGAKHPCWALIVQRSCNQNLRLDFQRQAVLAC